MKQVLSEQNKYLQNHWYPIMKACAVEAISQGLPFSIPVIDDEKYAACRKCTNYCSYGTFSMANQSIIYH